METIKDYIFIAIIILVAILTICFSAMDNGRYYVRMLHNDIGDTLYQVRQNGAYDYSPLYETPNKLEADSMRVKLEQEYKDWESKQFH